MSITPKFTNQKGTRFHQELKSRVNAYFEEHGKKMTGNWALYSKAIILFACYLFIYVHLIFFTPPAFWAIAECLVMGGLTAAIGFNVMHDGAHGSFSRHSFFNTVAAFSGNIMGASGIMWRNKHNLVHHTYTNIDGVDDDIEIKPMLRMCETQKRYKVHKYQHIYFWVLYTLLLLVWLFFADYQRYFSKKIGAVAIKKMAWWEHISFWAAKAGYIFMMAVLPIYLLGFMPWLTGFLVMSLFAGLVLSIVFQLAHTVEETSFPVPDDAMQIESEWALHQLKTTANFATGNKLVSWLVGGLNFQIEHHLFPKISHVHYPAISKIIRSTCEEFDIRYIEFRKMRHALFSHVMHLKKMGMA